MELKKLCGTLRGVGILVVGKPCDLAIQLLDEIDAKLAIFDVMDNMSAFGTGSASRWMTSAEKLIASKVDVLMASSNTLASLLRQRYPSAQIHCIRNGLTQPHIASLDITDQPRVQPCIMGYVGVIASWFDWSSVIRLAKESPDAQIHLYGPVETRIPSDLPANIKFFTGIPQSKVYAVMQKFTLGLIPFLKNDLTDFVDPIKYYEYRAIGIPVLSTRFGDMNFRNDNDGVYFFDDIFSARISISKISELKSNTECKNMFCTENSWDTRFNAINFLHW